MQRNLSWIFFRSKLPDWTWWNVCFEELPREQQESILRTRTEEWKDYLIFWLCHVINYIWEECNILKE